MEQLGRPVFLGFTAKRLRPRADWPLPSVEEICSATDCQADTPEGLKAYPEWYLGGRVNTEEAVEAAVAAEPSAPGAQPFIFYAHRVYPVWFDAEGMHRGLHPALNTPALPQEPPLDRYRCLGYDLLEIYDTVEGCSPLSCNLMAQELPVNRYCLLDELDSAVEVGRSFGLDPPEPGDYVIIEVLRRD